MIYVIVLSKLNIVDGHGKIYYNNIIEKSEAVRIDILDKNRKPITQLNYKKSLEQGLGSLDIHTKNVPNGEYTYDIYVEDINSDGGWSMIDSAGVVNITLAGIDMKNKEAIDIDGKKYPLANATEINGIEQSLINKGSLYIGKQVQFQNNNFDYDGTDFSTNFTIPQPIDGYALDDAELNIYQEGRLIKTVTKSQADLYPQNIETVPTYDNLNAAGKGIVDRYLANKFLIAGFNSYTQLTAQRKIEVAPHLAPFITEQFRAGALFKEGQITDEQTRLKNMGIVPIVWDGTLADGSKAQNGSYKYVLVTSTKNIATNEIKKSIDSNVATNLVKATEVLGNELYLILSDDSRITLPEIQAVRG